MTATTQLPAPGPRRVPRRVAAAARRRVRDLVYGEGARESGLSRLVETHAWQTAGDTLLAVALAGTLFFSVPVGQARGRVALYLVLTMAPFAVVAPLLGPLLDRAPRGRRVAITLTALIRMTLAVVMSRAVHHADPLTLYPAAFGVLVASKVYGVSRSAAMPRLLPPRLTLVQANARLSLAALVPATLAAPLAAGVNAAVGSAWTLRAAAVVYLVTAVWALRLPGRIDHPVDREPMPGLAPAPGRGHRTPASVARVLRSAAALRGLSGFLLLFVAFLARHLHVFAVPHTLALGLLAAAVGVGGLAGTAAGVRVGDRRPEVLVRAALLASTALCVVTAAYFGLVTVLLLALLAAIAQSLSKLSLDAVIQRDVDESVRTSTFARSETALQLAWVVGGGVGIALPPDGTVGFALAASVLALALLPGLRRPRPPDRERA